MLVPFAMDNKVINCACISVGNPGYGSVWSISIACILSGPITFKELPLACTSTPTSLNLDIILNR